MKILFFDCETSGLTPAWNKMLQLSWQLVDTCRWKLISKQNFYFKQPGKERVEQGAIRVNGLTKEHLMELGTVPRSKAIKAFAKDMAKADICVAHNWDFDYRFISEEDTKQLIPWKIRICTMKSTVNLCKLPFPFNRYDDDDEQLYKYPKLSELARCLGINPLKFDLHDAGADVELTKQCYRILVKSGYFEKDFKSK